MEFSELNQALGQITQTASENSAWSAQQAQIQREWQERQNAILIYFLSFFKSPLQFSLCNRTSSPGRPWLPQALLFPDA